MKSARPKFLLLLLGLQFAFANCFAAAPVCDSWPAWRTYKTHLLDGGRVVDVDTPEKITTSESQAYGLFFSLVANDRESFDRIFTWTENNLAQGDLTAYLPAWQWGHREDDSWGVMDANPASDADLWIAYTLAEAGRLWNERRYRVLSQLLAHRILREETAMIPGLGLSLLPGSRGFQVASSSWRLNPSYVPLQLLRGLAASDAQSPWPAIIEASIKLLQGSAPAGYAPDWVLFEDGKGFVPDPQTEAIGSYNAIRVYLWAGMLDQKEPHRQSLLKTLNPMVQKLVQTGVPPESVNTITGESKGAGPIGFSAALVPFLLANRELRAANEQLQRIESRPADPKSYYGHSLTLFGLGWRDGYFRFTQNGALKPRWNRACVRTRG